MNEANVPGAKRRASLGSYGSLPESSDVVVNCASGCWKHSLKCQGSFRRLPQSVLELNEVACASDKWGEFVHRGRGIQGAVPSQTLALGHGTGEVHYWSSYMQRHHCPQLQMQHMELSFQLSFQLKTRSSYFWPSGGLRRHLND